MHHCAVIICIGDTHFPFHDRVALSMVMDFISDHKKEVTHVVQMGDLLDQYCFSKFSKRYVSSDKEIKSGRHFAEKMWLTIQSIVPGAELTQITGNHDVRMFKRAQERLPEGQEIIKQYAHELYTFDNVNTLHDPREPLWIRDIRFLHGYKKHGTHMLHSHHKTVVGHLHVGGIVYRNIEKPNGDKEVIWELNAGFLGDEIKFQDVLGYTPEKMTGWTLGLGVIDKYGPRFINL